MSRVSLRCGCRVTGDDARRFGTRVVELPVSDDEVVEVVFQGDAEQLDDYLAELLLRLLDNAQTE
jgi:hypothetical protein